MKLGIIIQARINSTRLPSKITRSINDEDTFLDFLLSRLSEFKDKFQLILASSLNEDDKSLGDYAKKHNICFFRGSENNVSRRFIDAARENDIDTIVRVCSDNPFLDMNELNELINSYNGEDYLSFSVNGKPSILTHFGFFAEIVKLDSLIAVSDNRVCNEHVTNCIYTNPKKFKVKFIEKKIEEENVRCTLDTKEDLDNIKFIYKNFLNRKDQPKNFNYSEIVDFVVSNEMLINKMKKEIKKNLK